MEAKCPHCGKTIQLVGAKQLNDDYQLNGNKLQYLRDAGKFPEPWIKLENRNIYLKSDVDAFRTEQAQENAGKTAEALQAILDSLPPDEAAKVLESLSRPSGGA
jgi:hypothetical protein